MKNFLLVCFSLTSFQLSAQLADSSYNYRYNLNTHAWDLEEISTYTYNGQGLVHTVTNRKSSNGTLLSRSTFTYNSNGDLTNSYNEVYDSLTSQWKPGSQQENTYTSTFYPITRKHSIYDEQAAAWEIDYGDSFKYTYDGLNRITEYEIHVFSNMGPEPLQKVALSDFNASGEATTIIVQTWTGNGFEDYLKLEKLRWDLGYHPLDFDPTAYWGYSEYNGNWTPQVYDTTLVSNGKKVGKLLFNWNGSTLDSNERREYFYDSHDHLYKQTTASYITNWGITNGNLDSIVYGNSGEKAENIVAYYSLSTMGWIMTTRMVFYYHGLSSVEEAGLDEVNLYPNPCGDVVGIEVKQEEMVMIYDLHGKVMLQTIVNPAKPKIDVSALKAGVYIIRTGSGKGRLVVY